MHHCLLRNEIRVHYSSRKDNMVNVCFNRHRKSYFVIFITCSCFFKHFVWIAMTNLKNVFAWLPRPRIRWKDAVPADLSRIGVQQREMEAQDHKRWRVM